ncbi:asparagine synthase-related protein [Desulfonatronospira sp.]|uniref:asparagine synthase-related protein n=1 Tax=Desulfonatronospira sp. TaxID=1962951 RepID=UPI0025C0367B|nr:asparagine synthase-related protein [Desulfonatronospira sp.]
MSAFFFRRRPENGLPISSSLDIYLKKQLSNRTFGKTILHIAGPWEIYHRSLHQESWFVGSGIEVFLDGYFCDTQEGLFHSYSQNAALFAQWWQKKGLEHLADLDGGFAVLVRDSKRDIAYLIRDRWGSKPLYFSKVEAKGDIIGGSEIKLLIPWIERIKLDQAGLKDSISLRAIVGQESLYAGISQLVAASLMTIDNNGNPGEQQRYYKVKFEALDGPPDFRQWVEQTDAALRKSISQMAKTFKRVAIPLSGGIDSALLVAYSREYFKECIAFSVAIENFTNPELERARLVAGKLGIKHEIVSLGPKLIPELFQTVNSRIQEPCRHFNNIVLLHLLNNIQGCDAILCGDGADFLFGSPTLRTVINLQYKISKLCKIPSPISKISAKCLSRTGRKKFKHLANLLTHDIDWFIRRLHNVDYKPRETNILAQMGIKDVAPNNLLFERAPLCSQKHTGRCIETNLRLFIHFMMQRNDRLSSNTGAELLYPYLTDPVINLGQILPDEARFHGATLKPVLRRLCDNLVDEKISKMPKLGFPSPELSWINKDLIEFRRNAYFSKSRLKQFMPFKLDLSLLANDPASCQLTWWFMTLEESLRVLGDYD